MKYYVRTGYDGKPLDRFIHTFKNNPGDPYKEITIPSCCSPDTRTFILELVFSAPACTGGWNFYIDGVQLIPNPEVIEDQTDVAAYVAYLNIAFAGVLSFEVVLGDISVTILTEFTTFRAVASWVCE